LQLFASVSDVQTAEEFLASRRLIYVHDRRRYPFYFGRASRAQSLFVPSIVKATATTAAIEEVLVDTVLSARTIPAEGVGERAATLAAQQLAARENRAITYALFRRGRPDPMVGHVVRKCISVAYSRHHIALIPGATIIPGVFELAQLDAELLGHDTAKVPQFGWMIELLRWCDPQLLEGLASLNARSWNQLSQFALSPSGREFRLRLAAWKRSQAGGPTRLPGSREFRQLSAMLATIERQRRWQDSLTIAAEYMWPRLLPEDLMSSTVLIHCVNPNERLGILRACRDAGMSAGQTTAGTYVAAESLGAYGSLDFILVRSGAGSVGQDSAQGVISDAIDDFRPRIVVAVGVAFGLKVSLSAVRSPILVASTVKNYERVRMSLSKSGETDIRDRGEVGNPDPIRLQKLRTVADHGRFNVHVGQVLSGEKLVDHPDFRRHLQDRFPDAIGGEMEASGVAAACARRRIPWLIAKAVSDHGDGKKSTMHRDEDAVQERAAYAAMKLVLAAADADCL
jgi:nucleoside phosphorylase